jgi:hypothetical protein
MTLQFFLLGGFKKRSPGKGGVLYEDGFIRRSGILLGVDYQLIFEFIFYFLF